MAAHSRGRILPRLLPVGLCTLLLLGSCGLESTISLCPLPEDSNIDPIVISFEHLLCGTSSPPPAQVNAFRGYDLYYRIYGDSNNQQSRRDADIEAIQDPQRQAVTTLNARNYRRFETFNTQDQALSRPTIDLSDSNALRRGPVDVTIDFSNLEGDNDVTVTWNTSSEEVTRVLRRNNESDNGTFTTDGTDYTAGDADVDNQLGDEDLGYEIVLFAVSFGRDPDELGAISSFEARLLTDLDGLKIADD